MSVRNAIDALLASDDADLLGQYRGREIEFLKERGRLFPEKIEELFYAIWEAKYSDIVLIGPRGGGKTMDVYDAVSLRFIFLGDDVFAVAGSEAQAINGFRYMRQLVYRDKQLAENLEESKKKEAVTSQGNWFRIAAASPTGVRGPHPGDPHEQTGWQAHGGVLIKDERDEMDDDIADSVDFTMDIADPSIIITTSTMHRDDGGGIAQMAEEAEARGAHVIKFDVFDVSEVCMHDCAKCPGKHAFAGKLYGGATPKKNLANGAPALPRPTPESRKDWTEYKKQNAWPAGEPAYCEGRAKQHRPGHYKMDKIFRAFKRSRNREIFEVELCCRKRRGAKRVVDSAALDRCLDEVTAYQPGYDTPIATIDWGLKGWCVPILLQGQMDNTIAVIDVRYEHMTSADGIVEILNDWREATGMYQVYADASHPYENLKLAENGFEVVEVPFAKWKEYGAGWMRGIVERNQLRLPGKLVVGTKDQKPQYIFANDAVGELHKQIKGWQRDKHGKIVKKDDHGPDSLSCAAQHFTEQTDWDPTEVETTGKRTSYGLGG